MIKRHQQLSIIFLTSLALIVLFWRIFSSEEIQKTSPKPIPSVQKTAPVIDFKERKIDGKKVVGLPPGKEEESLKHVQVANTVSEEWEENLEENLRAQGGSALKEITIRRVESLIWIQDGIALNVESAMVAIKDDRGAETKFRVLVDSQTGKILKNWDQPIIDPSNPRENFGIKVDPRYHQD